MGTAPLKKRLGDGGASPSRYHRTATPFGIQVDGPVSNDSFFCRATRGVLLLALAGCAARPQMVRSYAPAANPRGVIFAVDGAGGFHALSDSFRQALQEQGVPLGVEVVKWSHGYGDILADQTDFDHIVAQGRRLAAQVSVYRQCRPRAEIYLVAHSAGA